MIISNNKKPSLEEFKSLMRQTDELLNKEANERDSIYYADKNGTMLEELVYCALDRAAFDTPFKGTIELVSGTFFPDIVANKYYGVEVKSTNKNHWHTIGSSILESTRVPDVEKIFLTFGKLGAPVKFCSRPYEECLRGIAVTHYPRYQIDMELPEGHTIFDKMGVTYDELRKIEDPAGMVSRVSQYYKAQLQPGESLWWANSRNIEEEVAPATVRLWTTLSSDRKEVLTAQGYAFFPEVLESGNQQKYNRYALWLVTKQGVVNTNIRDSFSAGGKVPMEVDGNQVNMPAVFGRICKYHELIEETLNDIDAETLREYWGTEQIEPNRLRQWCNLVAAQVVNHDVRIDCVWALLYKIFPKLKNS